MLFWSCMVAKKSAKKATKARSKAKVTSVSRSKTEQSTSVKKNATEKIEPRTMAELGTSGKKQFSYPYSNLKKHFIALGSSGSGKTVTASSIMGLMDSEEGKIDDGEILYLGENLLKMTSKKLEDIRGKQISYVFQNPSQALNPYIRVGNQLLQSLKTHKLAFSKEIILNALLEVGLKDVETIYNMYPFQLSGGQNQRIMIAQCIICKPDLLIADEPTSSIDSSLRKKLLDLFIHYSTNPSKRS